MALLLFASSIALIATQSLTNAALPSRCPTSESLQSNMVKSNFEDRQMDGFWYELAMKDATQPRKICKCQTSEKKVSLEDEEIRDDFTIECYGKTYHCDLRFNLTDTPPGVSVGTWHFPVIDRIRFPNTVVDYSVNEAGEYEWIIEFQCVESPAWMGNRIVFYAFNFYSKTYDNADTLVPIMEARARERGLGDFIDDGRPLAIIDHSECLYGH